MSPNRWMVLCCYGFFTFQVMGQANLVLNPSFEQYDSCTNYQGNVNTALNWGSANMLTPDYFKPCNSYPVSAPINYMGFQNGQDSVSYVGIEIADIVGAREGFQGLLSVPLVAGKYYCFEMYISIADTMKFGINEMGVYFDNDTILASNFNSNNNSLPYQLKLDVSNVLDTTYWHLITGGYLANGGEKYFVISSFAPLLTYTQFRNSSFNDGVTYYYIDNVSLVECTYPTFFIPGGFSPNGDGLNDVFEIINLAAYPNNSLYIINRWGDMVYKAAPYNNDWDGKANTGLNITNGKVTDGTYFYVFTPSPGADPVKGSLEMRRNN